MQLAAERGAPLKASSVPGLQLKAPARQLTAEEEPEYRVKLPSGQGWQALPSTAPPTTPKVFKGQGTQAPKALPFEKLPAPHRLQLEAPGPADLPAGQARQALRLLAPRSALA